MEAFAIELANGGVAAARLARPAASGRHGAVILCHEWWGLNADMDRLAERFAAEGFLALAVDLYGGKSTTDAGEAMKLVDQLKTGESVEIVAAAVKALRARSDASGKVAVTGFCLGGAIAIAAGCGGTGVDAAVPFYGIPKPEFSDFSQATCPFLGHYATRDGFITRDRVDALMQRASAAGARFELHFYDADHAFMREEDAHVYDAPSAALAWQRTIGFLRATLG